MTDETLNEAAVAAAWDRNAALWTEEVRAGFDFYRELYTLPAFLDFMPSVAGQKVIDLGCGEGSNTRRFAQRGGIMTGIDLSPEMITSVLGRRRRKSLSASPMRPALSAISRFLRTSSSTAPCRPWRSWMGRTLRLRCRPLAGF